MNEIKDLLRDKNLALIEAMEDFEQERINFMTYLKTVEQIALEISEILDKWDFMAKH